MRKLCAVAVPLGLIIVVLVLVWMGNENFCADMNRTTDLPLGKKITNFLFLCS